MNFEKYAAHANRFVKDLAEELGTPADTDRAGRVLRTVLHTLRRRLTPEESMNLVAQLPMMIKAIYVDGWKLGTSSDTSITSDEDFVDAMMDHDGRMANIDFPTPGDAEAGARAVFRVLKRHVSSGELADVQQVLPKRIRELFLS